MGTACHRAVLVAYRRCMMIIPPRSPYGLLQEDLCHSEWLVLVACIMLNCTTRKQVEKILPEFMRLWPDPMTFLAGDERDVIIVIKSLGFANRRAMMLRRMTEAFVTNSWKHAAELPGVGQYAARAWEIFCRGILGTEPPKDHALVQYWTWARSRSLHVAHR